MLDGIIDEGEGRRLRHRLDAQASANRAKHAAINAVAEQVKSAAGIDPADAGARAAFDAYYDEVASTAEAAGDDGAARTARDNALVTRAGMVPATLLKGIRRDLMAGDADALAATAARLQRFSKDKQVLDDLSARLPAADMIRARAISLYTDLGLAPADSIRLGDQRLADGAARLKARKARAQQQRQQQMQAEVQARQQAHRSLNAQRRQAQQGHAGLDLTGRP